MGRSVSTEQVARITCNGPLSTLSSNGGQQCRRPGVRETYCRFCSKGISVGIVPPRVRWNRMISTLPVLQAHTPTHGDNKACCEMCSIMCSMMCCFQHSIH